jgi:AsmA protein
MKALKIVAWVAAGLVTLVIVLVLAAVLFVNPNDYRDRIGQAVKHATGRDLALTGDLHLKVFPWIALSFGPAGLSNAAGFGSTPFASIQEARVSVRLLPLLRGRLDVGTVHLSGAEIHLMKDAQGRNNWSDLTQPKPGSEKETADTSSGNTFAGVGGIEIDKTTVTIDDRQAKTQQALRNFELHTGALGDGSASKMTMKFSAQASADTRVDVDLTQTLSADFAAGRYQIKDLHLVAQLLGKGRPAKGVPIDVKLASADIDTARKQYTLADLKTALTWAGEGLPESGIPIQVQLKQANADLGKQTLTTAGMQADIAGVAAQIALTGSEILDAPKFAGKLSIAPVSLRDVMPKVGMKVPVTADPKVLTRLSLDADIAAAKSSVALNHLTLKLDDTTATGTMSVVDFAAQALRFDLNVDRIDADRYLAAKKPEDSSSKTPAGPPTEIPVETLRKLNARGTLRLGQATFSGLKFTDLQLDVNARDGDVKLAPTQASMYGGHYRGSVAIDATTAVPALDLQADVSDVNFAPLLKDLLKKGNITGRGHLGTKLQARGKTTDAWFKSLNGNVDFKVADGAYEGFDLWYEIRRARALLRQQTIPATPSPARTVFTSLQGTGKLANGVLTNNDLLAATQYLRVNGNGSVNLAADTLDYRLNATVLRIPPEDADASGEKELVDMEVPARVTGSLSSPKVRPDIEELLKKQATKKLENKLKDKLRGILGGH